MIYETLYTITILALSVGLIFSWRKQIQLEKRSLRRQIKLKQQILELHLEIQDLEGYTKALHHVNRTNMETISHLYKTTTKN